MRSKRALVLAVLAALLLGTAAFASTFVAYDSRAMVDNSERVVQGRVIGVESFWNEDGRLIVTEATVRVSDTIVGTSTALVTVRVPGGTVNDLRVEAAGFPSFAAGQDVILFLSSSDRGNFQRVVGHQQGHFEVVERNDGVSLAVPQIDEGARLLTRSGARLPTPRSTELSEFKNRVRGLAERAGRIVN